MSFRIRASLLALASLVGPVFAQGPIGRMPGDVPYANEYGTNAPGLPPVMPAPAPPVITPIRPPEQSPGYQSVRPAPRSESRVPERYAVPPERIPPRGRDNRGQLIEVPGPRILER